MFGTPPKTVAAGDWLRVKYFAEEDNLNHVEMKVGPDEWRSCFHDTGDVMIRARSLPSGWYTIKMRQNGQESSIGETFVVGSTSSKGKPSAKVRTD